MRLSFLTRRSLPLAEQELGFEKQNDDEIRVGGTESTDAVPQPRGSVRVKETEFDGQLLLNFEGPSQAFAVSIDRLRVLQSCWDDVEQFLKSKNGDQERDSPEASSDPTSALASGAQPVANDSPGRVPPESSEDELWKI